ncbi:MAG: hypothetical protein JOZ87_04220 [Chloroflexi bacterium]|nr:hypothetical protein [Chloroflexota bacterium]
MAKTGLDCWSRTWNTTANRVTPAPSVAVLKTGQLPLLILAGQFLLKGLMLLADVATMSDLHPARTRTPELATRAPLWNGA